MNFRAVTLVLAASSFAVNVSTAAGGRDDSESETPRAGIVVLVYNAARLPSEALRASQDNAASIFRQAGVPTRWVNCSAKTGSPPDSAICRSPLTPAVVVVRLLRAADVPKARFGSDTVGFASVLGNERGAYATVFYDAVAAAEPSQTDLELALGHALAHELGHLFLRSNEHSVSGVMRATWGPRDRLLAASNRLLFLPEQAKRIRAEFEWRMAHQADEWALASGVP